MLLLLILVPLGLLGTVLLLDAVLDPQAGKDQCRWPASLIVITVTPGVERLLADRFSGTGRTVFAVVVAVAVVREYRRIP